MPLTPHRARKAAATDSLNYNDWTWNEQGYRTGKVHDNFIVADAQLNKTSSTLLSE